MSKLYLIKHAMPELDPNVPAPDWRLGARGRALSELLAQKLGAYPLDVIVSSVEPKAIETAQIVAARLGKPFEIGEDLHEHERRNEPFTTRDNFEARVAEFFAKPNELVLGSETANQAHARFANAIARVIEKHPQKNIAVVAHGTVISLFVARTQASPFEFWKRLGLPSIVVLDVGCWTLEVGYAASSQTIQPPISNFQFPISIAEVIENVE
jgi:broad specificity phosphatase PhoE